MITIWIRAAALSLIVPLGGCIGTDFGDDLGEGASEETSCLAASLGASLGGLFQTVRTGNEGTVTLTGLCSVFEACSEDSPLMLDTHHAILLEALADEPMSVASSLPAVVSADNTGAVCQFAEGTLTAHAAGEADLIVRVGSAEVDRFHVEVASPASFALSAPDADDTTMPVLVPGEETFLQATVRDVDGRVLVAGSAIEWTFEDHGVLEVAGDDATRGGALFIKARAPGTTTVYARAATLEATLVVTVTP